MTRVKIWELVVVLLIFPCLLSNLFAFEEKRDGNILWIEDFTSLEFDDEKGVNGWRSKGAMTKDEKTVKIRDISGNGYDFVQRYVPFDEEYPYIQIKVLSLENPNNGWGITNSSSDGEKIIDDVRKTGIFTFDFKEIHFETYTKSGSFALTIYTCGSKAGLPPEPGGYVEFEWLKMISKPENAVLMKLVEDKDSNRIINIGDKLRIEVILRWPAKRVVVDFKQVYIYKPFTFDGDSAKTLYDDGTHGDTKANDNIWTTEFLVTNEATQIKTGEFKYDRQWKGTGRILITAHIEGGNISETYTGNAYEIDTTKK